MLVRSFDSFIFLQAATAAQLVPGALLPVPSYPAASPTGGRGPTTAVAVAVGGVQQYVPVTMVDHQGGRLMVGATWAAPSGRQMTLVPSWQQPATLQQSGTLLVPAPDEWRRPLLTDNAQGIRFAQGLYLPPPLLGWARLAQPWDSLYGYLFFI